MESIPNWRAPTYQITHWPWTRKCHSNWIWILRWAASTRDPHIILFFHPIILFSNSFFDFPLFFEYFPIILIILHDLGTYAALRAWLGLMPEGETRLIDVELTVHYRIYTGRERVGERRRSSREGWLTTKSDSINSLQLASLDVDVDDAIITISGHCTKQ